MADEHRPILGAALGLPSSSGEALNSGRHSAAEVHSGLKALAFDDLPLRSPYDDVARLSVVLVSGETVAAHTADCRALPVIPINKNVCFLLILRDKALPRVVREKTQFVFSRPLDQSERQLSAYRQRTNDDEKESCTGFSEKSDGI